MRYRARVLGTITMTVALAGLGRHLTVDDQYLGRIFAVEESGSGRFAAA
jgi:hypothetical protein